MDLIRPMLISVLTRLSLWEGRRCLRRLRPIKNLTTDAGLDMVAAFCWAQLLDGAVIGTDGTSDNFFDAGPSVIGALAFGAGGLVTTTNAVFDPAWVGRKIGFDLPDDYGRTSFTIFAFIDARNIQIQPVPTYAVTPAPGTLHVFRGARVALGAPVKYAPTAGAGNSTTVAALAVPPNTNQVIWNHHFNFTPEPAPGPGQIYREIGWLPVGFAGLNDQIQGRVVIPGGLPCGPAQHVEADTGLVVNFGPVKRINALPYAFAGALACGANVIQIRANGTYLNAVDIAPGAGFQLWSEPSTFATAIAGQQAAMAASPVIAGAGGIFQQPVALAALYALDPMPAVAYAPGAYAIGWNQIVPQYPLGANPLTWSFNWIDPLDINPANPNRNLWMTTVAAFAAGDPVVVPPGFFTLGNFSLPWDRLFNTLP
jgi:hypothetical protein